MVKLDSKAKENPRLEQKEMADGRISLYLEYYLGRVSEPVLDEHGEQVYYTSGAMEGKPKMKITHNRKKEHLNLYLIAKPRTPIERQQNKETLDLAKTIRTEREQELKEGILGYRLKSREMNFWDFLQTYQNNYTKKDIRVVQLSVRRFKEFIAEEHRLYTKTIKPAQITPKLMADFVEYLQSVCKGTGAITAWKRWKTLISNAVKDGVFKKNPCTGIVCTSDENILTKDILSMEEIKQLISTTYEGQNMEVRKAFIFSLYTGIRYCDVKDLAFKNVDRANRMLSFEQNKTKGHSKYSGVTIPLNDGLLSLIGERTNENPNELLFKLPSHTGCLKSLRTWTQKAGINKHITWHCGRHSFAVNILNNGANIKTVASLLGHSGLQHTEKYTRAIDRLKEDAINSLPELKL